MPEEFGFQIPMVKPGGVGTYFGLQTALLPHEVFSSIYEAGSELFDHIFVGGPGNLERFWELK